MAKAKTKKEETQETVAPVTETPAEDTAFDDRMQSAYQSAFDTAKVKGEGSSTVPGEAADWHVTVTRKEQ